MSPYLLGIDSGLTVTKAVVFDEEGRERGMGAVNNAQKSPHPRWVEQDMDRVWEGCRGAVRQALDKAGVAAGEITAVGVTGHGDGEAQLSASLLEQESKDLYFWYIPFELPDFESPRAAIEALVDRATKVMGNPSRILQRRGLLFWSFEAEFLEADEWTSAGGVSAFRFGGFHVPETHERERAYHSPRVLR
jgi:hypothetical protein